VKRREFSGEERKNKAGAVSRIQITIKRDEKNHKKFMSRKSDCT
jgi:hypothetical protein